MTWRVLREDVELFRRELWKDERSFGGKATVGADEFLKDCFDDRRATIELKAIAALRSSKGEQLCPPARAIGSGQIALRRIPGIRLFDLIRLLRELELTNRDGRASLAIRLLMGRQRERLGRIQKILLESSGELAACPYPMGSKLSDLLNLLSRIFGAEESFAAACGPLSTFTDYWASECCLIPFRDATVKNCLVEEPTLDPRSFEDETDRLLVLQESLMEGNEYWSSVPLWDVDFSSVEHLTAPEDDPISLHCHEWTDGTCELSPDALLLLGSKFAANSYRAAAALLVRYLRFGGRKLAYKVINAQGFEVRFRYDNPLFYFENVRDKCKLLSSQFVQDYAALFAVVEDVGHRASNPSPADEALLRIDHFRRFFPNRADYWQENPGERRDQSEPRG